MDCVRHPQHGATIGGRVLVMPGTRGSTSGTGVLAESLRLGTGPAAIVVAGADVPIVTSVPVADLLYGRSIPVVLLDGATYDSIETGDELAIGRDGALRHAAATENGDDEH